MVKGNNKGNAPVWYRATFVDGVTPDMQITIEFLAYKNLPELAYQELAEQAFMEAVSKKQIKIKFIEPVEVHK